MLRGKTKIIANFNFENYGCIIGGVDGVTVFRQSPRQSILKTSQQHQYCFHFTQILYYGKCEFVVHIKIYFRKIDILLSEILAGQKCIK